MLAHVQLRSVPVCLAARICVDLSEATEGVADCLHLIIVTGCMPT